MKRSTLLTLSVVTLMALQAAPALAGKKSRKNDQNQQQNQQQNHSQNQQQFQQQQRKFNVQSLLNGQPDWQGVFKKHKHHDDDDAPNTPLDPGRPDDRVPVDEPVTPPSRPGYVWVNGHWERERAPQKVVVSNPVLDQGPVVRDHRTEKPPFVSGGQGQGGVTVTSGNVTSGNGPIIRDHRDSSTSNGGVTVTSGAGPTIRDHRDSVTIFNPTGSKIWTAGPTVRDHRTTTPPPLAGKNGQGGVTVTTTPGGGSRDNAITGSGPNPLDLLAEGAAKVGNVFGIGYGEVTSGGGSAPTGPTIRDHRTTAPVVRDHRTGQ